MRKAGIGIDPYKLKTFEEELTKAGYTYTKGELTKNVLMLFIEFKKEDFKKVKDLITKINLKAQVNKDHN